MDKNETIKRLLCVLHCGYVEIRHHTNASNLSEATIARICKLSDILEVIPLYIYNWSPAKAAMAIAELKVPKDLL